MLAEDRDLVILRVTNLAKCWQLDFMIIVKEITQSVSSELKK